MESPYIKGRGAQINTPNRFDPNVYDKQPVDWTEDESLQNTLKTEYLTVYPKTIINKVNSPDLPHNFSMNPYQGCEHGCVYCYARNSHTYWGYSAGLEFEQKILLKKKAATLLAKKLKSAKWKAEPIMLSGNTDCYQPIEQKMEITRHLLEVLWRYRHPVGIITKNNLILRDLDILQKMASENLVKVVISITTLDEKLRQKLEPRTSTGLKRIKTISKLSKAGIPTMGMMAPIIPGLNEHEIFEVAKACSRAGAYDLSHTIIRLNGDLGEIFENWILKAYPDKAEKVLNKIKSIHKGKLGSSEFGKRMKGEGKIAEIIAQQMQMAKKKYFNTSNPPPFNVDLHRKYKKDQLSLF